MWMVTILDLRHESLQILLSMTERSTVAMLHIAVVLYANIQFLFWLLGTINAYKTIAVIMGITA